jgi:Lon protease-like protein
MLAMFPLGSVLFPHMPVLLRVFEDRYLAMLGEILQDEPAEFGITLIERGQEVGGGEQRFGVGTVAQITQMDTAEGSVVLVAEGERRIRVVEWLEDDPYPRATVETLPELEWDAELAPLRERAETVVRRTLALASEVEDQQWSAAVELADDPVASLWQLAAISPLGPLDQVELLASSSTKELADLVIERTLGVEATIRASLG